MRDIERDILQFIVNENDQQAKFAAIVEYSGWDDPRVLYALEAMMENGWAVKPWYMWFRITERGRIALAFRLARDDLAVRRNSAKPK